MGSPTKRTWTKRDNRDAKLLKVRMARLRSETKKRQAAAAGASK